MKSIIPQTEDVIDISGNYKPAKISEQEAIKIFEEAKKQEAVKSFDSSELFKKMKQEWEQLQQNPSSVDDQIKAQLDMLQQINNNAFDEANIGPDGQEITNPTEIGRIMQEMLKKQKNSADISGSNVTAQYRSQGEPFQDP